MVFRQFFCFLLIVLVAEVATGVWAVYNKDRLDGMVRSAVERTVKSEYGVADDKTRAFDVFQQHVSEINHPKIHLTF